jgi:hypothetical protein
MAQEFTINSAAIESKINQLLPSQGGSGAGIDFSASTMVIPIVDLTESAEGSDVRQDLQTALSLNSITSFNVANTTSTILSTTGYYRIYGALGCETGASPTMESKFILTDGVTSKDIWDLRLKVGANNNLGLLYDFVVYLRAGESLQVKTNNVNAVFRGNFRQIADINGNLVNP